MKQPDYTFWTRLLNFVKDIKVSDFAGQEERDYIHWTAAKQLEQQYENCTDPEERQYLEITNKIN